MVMFGFSLWVEATWSRWLPTSHMTCHGRCVFVWRVTWPKVSSTSTVEASCIATSRQKSVSLTLHCVLEQSFDAHCCHMGTAIKHPMPDRIKPSFVIFDIRAFWYSAWPSECPDVKNYEWQLNPILHRMLYSCTHMATVGVKGLIVTSVTVRIFRLHCGLDEVKQAAVLSSQDRELMLFHKRQLPTTVMFVDDVLLSPVHTCWCGHTFSKQLRALLLCPMHRSVIDAVLHDLLFASH